MTQNWFWNLYWYGVWSHSTNKCARHAVYKNRESGSTVSTITQVYLGVFPSRAGGVKRQAVGTLDSLFRGGGGFIRGMIGALFHHVLSLWTVGRWGARAIAQDGRAGRRAAVRVTGSATETRKISSKKLILYFQRNTNVCWIMAGHFEHTQFQTHWSAVLMGQMKVQVFFKPAKHLIN